VEGKVTIPQRTGIDVIALILIMIVISFTALTVWAGLPPPDQLVRFWLGIIILLGVTVGIGLASWHLLLRPLPARLTATTPIPIRAGTRSIITLFLTLGVISIGIAGAWDELWHTRYGIPFGEDFFWRPHLLLYFSFSTLIIVGVWSWFTLQLRGKGTLQQRFHANPLLGVGFFASVFTLYSLVADPAWHALYGQDLSPWSVPHLLLLAMILVMALLAIAYRHSLMPARTWKFDLNIDVHDILIALVLAGSIISFMLILVIQWYINNTFGLNYDSLLIGYPDWLFGAFVTFLAVLFGTLALESTRRVGRATLVGIVAFGIRYAIDRTANGGYDGTSPLLFIIPLLLTLDILYAIYLQRMQKTPPIWVVGVVIGVVFGIVSYPLTAALYAYLPVSLMNIPGRIIVSAITAISMVWFARIVLNFNTGISVQTDAAAEHASTGTPLVSTLMYVAFTIFIVFFITTATPPV
jgi:hypothetical protein